MRNPDYESNPPLSLEPEQQQQQRQLVKTTRMKQQQQKKKKKLVETADVDAQTDNLPSTSAATALHVSRRSRAFHTFLSIPLACCLGGNGRGTITCSVDFSNNTVNNVADAPMEQDKKIKAKKKSTKPTKPKKKSEQETAAAPDDGRSG